MMPPLLRSLNYLPVCCVLLLLQVASNSIALDTVLATSDALNCRNNPDGFCAVQKPDDEYKVLQNSSVTIPCRVASNVGRLPHVFWKIKGFFIDKEVPLHRFNITGQGRDDYTLRISNMSFEDSGELECQVILDTKVQRFKTMLTVLIPPKQPVINEGVSILTVTNLSRPLSVTCECHEGYPMPELTWHLDGQPVKEAHVLADSQASASVRKSVSTLTMVPEKLGVVNGSRLECRAQNEALRMLDTSEGSRPAPADVVMFLVYEKVGRPVVTGARAEYRTGGRLELSCTALPGVPPGRLVWKRRRRSEARPMDVESPSRMLDGRLANIIAMQLGPEDHLARFTCQASNAATEVPYEESALLTVSCELLPDLEIFQI